MATPIDLIILDRDGVINEDSVDYIKSPNEWTPLPGSIEAIAELTRAAFTIVVVSNQSGIGRGLFTLSDVEAIHEKMVHTVAEAGGKLAGIYFCPHRPDELCDCRKPRTGMLERVIDDFNVSLAGVPLIGDKAADLELARRVEARPILVLTGYGQESAAEATEAGVEIHADLAAAARALIAERQ
ncbi:MAG: D-glycero-beta-D-manno-heptose 1,7-bisphosphate 7-phosphatase [Gammaproteobacteria bacterium]